MSPQESHFVILPPPRLQFGQGFLLLKFGISNSPMGTVKLTGIYSFCDAKSTRANTTNQRLRWHVDQWNLQEIR